MKEQEVEMKGQGGQAKNKVRLVQEVSPDEVISPEEARRILWNTPPPLEVQWWLDGDIPKKVLEEAGIPHVYWGRRALNAFDLFSAPPGFRLFGPNVPEILRALGYEVEVVTKEQLRELQERLQAEREREEQEEWERIEQRRRRWERLHQFAEKHGLLRLSGVGPVFDFFDGQPRSIPYEVTPDGGGRLYFGKSKKTGKLLLSLRYDTTCITFADPITFDAICEECWRRLTKEGKYDPHNLYFYCLVMTRFHSGYLGVESDRWVVERKAYLLEELRRDYVVTAMPNTSMGYNDEEAQRVCEEFGIEFRISRNHHGVFRKDRLPKDL
jgi:hypothetical protein